MEQDTDREVEEIYKEMVIMIDHNDRQNENTS